MTTSDDTPGPLHATLDVLERAHAHARSYVAGIHSRRVAPGADDLSLLATLDGEMPTEATEPLATIDLLHRVGSPATVASTGGRFFGLVVGGTLPAAVGARTLAAAWDQVVFNESTSPVGVTAERVASRWLLELLGLPGDAAVGFVTGATMANVTCLAAARESVLARSGWNVNRSGLYGAPRLRFVASDETHVTVRKALTLLGLGVDALEVVPSDSNGAMRADALPELDERTVVLAQAGNVNSGACDPIGRICDLAAANGAWVHVDGAFGLWAASSASTRDLLSGHERAHSWVVDGHKWLNTAYDCGIAVCREPQALHEAMRTQAPYLSSEPAAAVAPKDMVPEFSRSARGVEVWATLHSLGRQGVEDLVDQCCAHARRLADGLSRLGFDVLNDVVLNQVVVSMVGFEDQMAELAQTVRDSGQAWFGPTTWKGRQGVRFSIASWATTQDDIDRTLDAVAAAQRELGLNS